VAARLRSNATFAELLSRIRAEYLEMPASVQGARQRPEFSGEWGLDLTNSRLHEDYSVLERGVVHIDHREPTFTLRRVFTVKERPSETSPGTPSPRAGRHAERCQRSGYAPACANEWVQGVCEKPKIKCAVCPHRRFHPVTEDVIRWHLSGRDASDRPFVAGVYPLLLDETCHFLAVDFDKTGWQYDAMAFVRGCRRLGLGAALERSRSGRVVTHGYSQPYTSADCGISGERADAASREKTSTRRTLMD
jgi:hypothetical protein